MTAEITLLDLNSFPPAGWTYREPSLNWTNPDPLNGEGLENAIRLLQMVRAQNPAANLDPSYTACRDAIIAYTCTRLRHDPRWCGPTPAEAQRIAAAYPVSGRRCASCGRR